jgi:hypothetical protein
MAGLLSLPANIRNNPKSGEKGAMDFARILSELRSQRDNLNEAIFSLERLAQSGPKKRGRPPKRVTEARVSGLGQNGSNGKSGRPA